MNVAKNSTAIETIATDKSLAVDRLQTGNYVGRFAPSPTGPLHFGSLLAAVGSYLQARVAGGAWLIRIEDLDRPRVVPGAADHIIRTLASFGFEWHGAIKYQSQRLNHYAAAISQLRDLSCVYSCSCSRTEIAAAHVSDEQRGIDTDELRYPGTCRHRIQPHSASTALRFLVPNGVVEFTDRIQGLQTQEVAASVGDFVVQRREGIYAYHLAVTVDDSAQGITEIVRGADLLASTPRHILLQRSLGLTTPSYAHLPLALDTNGRKLSKSLQSLPIDPGNASLLLWQALLALNQAPPLELRRAPLNELWAWATVNWSLMAIAHQTTCPAPAPSP